MSRKGTLPSESWGDTAHRHTVLIVNIGSLERSHLRQSCEEGPLGVRRNNSRCSGAVRSAVRRLETGTDLCFGGWGAGAHRIESSRPQTGFIKSFAGILLGPGSKTSPSIPLKWMQSSLAHREAGRVSGLPKAVMRPMPPVHAAHASNC